MPKYISPELYNNYKHQVLEMSLAIQYYEDTAVQMKSAVFPTRK